MCCFEYGDQGGTFNGSALMTAIGNAVVETVSSPAFLADVAAKGEYLTQRLLELSARLGHGEVRGRGLLLALELKGTDAAKVSGAPWTAACCSTRRAPTRSASCRP